MAAVQNGLRKTKIGRSIGLRIDICDIKGIDSRFWFLENGWSNNIILSEHYEQFIIKYFQQSNHANHNRKSRKTSPVSREKTG